MKKIINDDITLVRTDHISEKNVKKVKKIIEKKKPDIVAVELCKRRYESITKKDQWENKPVTSLLKGNNAFFMLAQTFLSSIQRKLGKEYGVEPGSEMIAAMDIAKKNNLEVALVDRDISVTLKRAWKKMGIREKFRLVWEFLKAIIGFDEEELEDLDLEELMDQDVISSMMEEFGAIAPSVTCVLIHERDEYIAKKILKESKKGKVVAVVGAGHLEGIEKHIKNPNKDLNLKDLEYVPKKRFSILKILGYAIPVIFAALLVYIILTGGIEKGLFALGMWFLINGTLSAIGTIIARGHPLTWLTAFVAAPLTSLNPAIAAGWVAGWVEAKLRTPKIKDFKQLSKLDNFGDFWKNRVIRLLLVVALANVGSMIGTFVALPYLANLGFGA